MSLFDVRQFPAAQFVLQGLDQKEAGLHPQVGRNQQFLKVFQELGINNFAPPEKPIQTAAQGLPGPAQPFPQASKHAPPCRGLGNLPGLLQVLGLRENGRRRLRPDFRRGCG